MMANKACYRPAQGTAGSIKGERSQATASMHVMLLNVHGVEYTVSVTWMEGSDLTDGL